jgi:Kef-type K+ transport system membrane component KefB
MTGLGTIIALFVLLRVCARLLGGWAGAAMAGLAPAERRWVGAALMPQAGVAVGMALIAGNHFPELRQTLLSVTVAATILFEIAGPILTQVALKRASG